MALIIKEASGSLSVGSFPPGGEGSAFKITCSPLIANGCGRSCI